MKKITVFLLFITLFLGVQRASGQVTNDFSDWNVPPPVPPGTIPKGKVIRREAIIQQPVDIPAPSMPQITDIKLAALSPVLLTPLSVPAPEQPQFPALPFQAAGIPLPAIPDALDLPKQVPDDEIIEGATEMPVPPVPEMPELPNVADVKSGGSDQEVLKLPVVPAIIRQPATGIIPANPFLFMEWPAPAIPANMHEKVILPGNPKDNRLKPTTKKRPVKRHRGK